jgi:hypothetical protein
MKATSATLLFVVCPLRSEDLAFFFILNFLSRCSASNFECFRKVFTGTNNALLLFENRRVRVKQSTKRKPQRKSRCIFLCLLHLVNLNLATFLFRFDKLAVTTKREDLAEWGVVNPLYESKTLSGGDQVGMCF